MVYVYNNMASEIKRNPTKEEKEIVKKQEIIVDRLYELYNHNMDIPERIKLWDEYLKEYRIYNKMFRKYMGYCY